MGLGSMRKDKEELEKKIFFLIFKFEQFHDIQVSGIKLKSYEGPERKHIDEVSINVKL